MDCVVFGWLLENCGDPGFRIFPEEIRLWAAENAIVPTASDSRMKTIKTIHERPFENNECDLKFLVCCIGLCVHPARRSLRH